jgi:membrane fusion protein, heavy metal efflux system
MRLYLPFVALLSVCMLSVSCNKKTGETVISDDTLVEIKKSQFQSEKMTFGAPQKMLFPESVHFTGKVIPSMNGSAQVSIPLEGFIDRILCTPGELVSKGQVLFVISGNELMNMQKDFAESFASLKRLKMEYDRVKELFNDKIATQKEYILAESSYVSENARYTVLKIQLERLGLNVSEIENGNFFDAYPLKAPIKGYIANINATIGKYFEQQLTIAEIIDIDQFRLRLSVFEKDAKKIKIGQPLEFYSLENKNVLYHGELSSVGRSINDESKAIDCYAWIQNLNRTNLVGHQYVEGEIIVDADSVFVLPESALLKSDDKDYILNLEKETDESYFFRKVNVKTGRINKDYVELMSVPEFNRIIISGIYNVIIE